ncbi:MAG: hypothetical protein KAT17_00860 [Candidatus Aminicenantes bacterium]|nr:hypothetical protein [Candidatus Aminicenantes bacterium]
MKKSKVLILILLVLFFFSGEISGIVGTDFYLQAGAITDDSFAFDPFLWTVGVNFDLKLAGILVISPELNLINHGFDFDYFLLEPALMVNFKFMGFFIGAGLNKFFLIGDGYGDSTDFSMKLNIGFKFSLIKIRLYCMFPFEDFFPPSIYGIMIGVKF